MDIEDLNSKFFVKTNEVKDRTYVDWFIRHFEILQSKEVIDSIFALQANRWNINLKTDFPGHF